MEKIRKISIMILISLITSIISVVISFFGSYFLKEWFYIPFGIAIISVVLMYVIGMFCVYKKGIKNIFHLICFGLLIAIFDLISGYVLFSLIYFLLGLNTAWGESLYYSFINMTFLGASGYLAIFHIISILILLLINKIKKVDSKNI